MSDSVNQARAFEVLTATDEAHATRLAECWEGSDDCGDNAAGGECISDRPR